jgi:catalase
VRAKSDRKKDRTELNENAKNEQLESSRMEPEGTYLTTNQGLRVNHTDDSLKAGPRGPTLMEDFHFREKMTHFDHESIPERVVHARGSGAHGYFQPYESMAKYTRARFLSDPSVKTPVFVRFSTVVGSRGSADTVRDVRGFATKFYDRAQNRVDDQRVPEEDGPRPTVHATGEAEPQPGPQGPGHQEDHRLCYEQRAESRPRG